MLLKDARALKSPPRVSTAEKGTTSKAMPNPQRGKIPRCFIKTEESRDSMVGFS